MNSSLQKNTIVTEENILRIQQLLEEKKGGILLVNLFWDENPHFGCHMYLYNRAKIHKVKSESPERWAITTVRGVKKVGGTDLPTGWEDDRSYTLRLRTEQEESFPNKIIAKRKVAFFLGAHSTTYQNFDFTDPKLAIYIPDVGGNHEHAVLHGLIHGIDEVLKIRADVTELEFDNLWQYILQDLKDGKAMSGSLLGG